MDNKSVDDILSSIRDTVTAEQAATKKTAETIEDVLELTDILEEGQAPAQPTPAPAASAKKPAVDEEMVDIHAFAEGGKVQAASSESVEKAKQGYSEEGKEEDSAPEEMESKPEEPAADPAPAPETPAEAPPAAEAKPAVDIDDIDIDALMNEVAAEGAKSEESEEAPEAAEAEENQGANVDEGAAPTQTAEPDAAALAAEMLGETAPAQEQPAADDAAALADAMLAGTDSAAVAAPAPAALAPAEKPAEKAETQAAPVAAPTPPVAAEKSAQKVVHLSTVPSPKGLQVSFPVEVLAEALRPLVSTWVENNLADIVERLVREELSKLAEK